MIKPVRTRVYNKGSVSGKPVTWWINSLIRGGDVAVVPVGSLNQVMANYTPVNAAGSPV